jgi:hypothetical protein
MNTYFTIAIIVVIALLLVWTIASWKINSIDSPAYTVISSTKEYEVRAYEPYIVAETIVEGTRDEAITAGFRILANYIFGDNVARTKLNMTSPVVEQTTSSEKLAMTAPVIARDNSTTSHVISFVMPRGYTISTLPQPNDSRVVFNTIPAHAVAARKFSWYASEARINVQKEILSKAIMRDGLVRQGSISYAGYTAPFTIPFLEKHEVMVNIQR